eukprot:COSAG01_NODE_41452_length_451_cov_1.107955_2_plen_64_part_01
MLVHLRVRVEIIGLIIKELTEISLRFYIFAIPLSPPAPVHLLVQLPPVCRACSTVSLSEHACMR